MDIAERALHGGLSSIFAAVALGCGTVACALMTEAVKAGASAPAVFEVAGAVGLAGLTLLASTGAVLAAKEAIAPQ